MTAIPETVRVTTTMGTDGSVSLSKNGPSRVSEIDEITPTIEVGQMDRTVGTAIDTISQQITFLSEIVVRECPQDFHRQGDKDVVEIDGVLHDEADPRFLRSLFAALKKAYASQVGRLYEIRSFHLDPIEKELGKMTSMEGRYTMTLEYIVTGNRKQLRIRFTGVRDTSDKQEVINTVVTVLSQKKDQITKNSIEAFSEVARYIEYTYSNQRPRKVRRPEQ